MSDPEIDAMQKIMEALDGLEQSAINRVIKWAADRYNIPNIDKGKKEEPSSTNLDIPTDLSELFSNFQPDREADKVLVACYWEQYLQGKDTVDAQDINGDLKNLGHGVKNITRAFSTLMGQKPALVAQVRKGGSTKQARKKYKMTQAGKNAVEAMMNKS